MVNGKAYRLPRGELGSQTYRKVIVWHIVDGKCVMEEVFTPNKNLSKQERKEVIIEQLRSRGFLVEDL